MDEIVFPVSDVDDIRYVLNAVLMYFQARDLQDAQRQLNSVRPSPLTQDIDRVKQRVEHYFAQWLLERHEAGRDEYDTEDQEDGADDPEASEGLPEGSEGVLSDAPLGTPKVKRQTGRRVSVKELKKEQ